MTLNMTATHTSPIRLRPFRTTDAGVIAALLAEGHVLAGPIPAASLTPADAEVDYFAQPPNHLWVAEVDGLIVGVAGLKHEQPMIARLAVLCIDEAWADARVAEHLLQATLQHCHYFGYLKLVTETSWPTTQIINLFARCGLRYTRHRGEMSEPTCLLEFYVDLYRQGRQTPPGDEVAVAEPQVVVAR